MNSANRNKIKIIFSFLGIVTFIAIFFYINPLTSFFSQDDFYHLRQVADKNISEIPKFFLPNYSKEQTFYRPLSREVYNFIMLRLFTLSPLPYHIANFLLIVLISVLAFKFIYTISKDMFLASVTLLLYLINSIHSVEIYYLASVQTLLSTTFVLSCLIFYSTFKNTQKKIYLFLAILFFLFALLSHESAIVSLGVIVLLEVDIGRKINAKGNRLIFFRLLPFIILSFLRSVIYFFVRSLPSQSVYRPDFSPVAVLNSLSWFTLWSFGLPEMLKDFITLKLNINPNFLIWYKDYVYLTFPLVIFIIFSLLMILFLYKSILLRDKLFYFFILSFVISLSPFLFFPEHKFTYYMSLPVIWFSAAVARLLVLVWENNFWKKSYVIILITSFAIIYHQTTKLNQITHWAAKRSVAAKDIITDFKSKYPNLPKGAQIFIENDPNYPKIAKDWGDSSRQVFYILSGSDAFQLFYGDKTLKVYYENFDKQKTIETNIIYRPVFRY